MPSANTEGLSIADAELDVGDVRRESEGVARRSVDLGRAAQRVGVLYLRGVVEVRAHDDRVGEQREEVRGADHLAGVRTKCVDLGEEDLVGTAQRLDRHRGRDVDEFHQRHAVFDREDQLPEHPVGAVDERQALLLGEDHRRRDR